MFISRYLHKSPDCISTILPFILRLHFEQPSCTNPHSIASADVLLFPFRFALSAAYRSELTHSRVLRRVPLGKRYLAVSGLTRRSQRDTRSNERESSRIELAIPCGENIRLHSSKSQHLCLGRAPPHQPT